VSDVQGDCCDMVRFLDNIPGNNDGTVQQHLCQPETSGNYQRIISEVPQKK
jgi:hypothetical protein